MKRRTTPTLEVMIDTIDLNQVTTIDFMFKQECDESCTVKVKKTYPTDVTYDNTKKVFLIPFTENDCCTFRANDFFWMDTRIVLSGNKVPETEMVKLKMHNTLFGAGDIT